MVAEFGLAPAALRPLREAGVPQELGDPLEGGAVFGRFIADRQKSR
jgi:hypothetical protein